MYSPQRRPYSVLLSVPWHTHCPHSWFAAACIVLPVLYGTVLYCTVLCWMAYGVQSGILCQCGQSTALCLQQQAGYRRIAVWADSGLGCGCHCAALGNLAGDDENQRAIAAAGGVVAVVGAMRAHPAAAGVQDRGCNGAWGPVCWLVLGLSAAGCAWGVGGGSHALPRTVCALWGRGMPVRG